MELNVQKLRCDPNYFAENILKLNLHEGQKTILNCQDRFISIRAARRFGKSYVSAAIAAHAAATNNNYKIICVSRSQRQSTELFHTIEKILNGSEMKNSIVRQTQTMLVLSNGSSISALPGGSPNSLRGITVSLLVADEAAYISQELVSVVYPTIISTKGRIILISTPAFSSGEFFRSCGENSEFTRFHFCHEDAVFADGTPFISKEELDREMERCGGEDSSEYIREYLAEFTTSEGAYFDINELDDAFSDETSELKFGLPDRKYAMGCDLAQISDFTVFVIMDYTDPENVIVVRTVRFNGKTTEEILALLYAEARAFEVNTIQIDIAGIGRTLLELLYARYASINWRGFTFTKESKLRIMTNLSMMLGRRHLQLPEDDNMRNEFVNFYYKENPDTKNIKMGSRGGFHDDIVISVALALEATGIFQPRGGLTIGLSGNRLINSGIPTHGFQPVPRRNILT